MHETISKYVCLHVRWSQGFYTSLQIASQRICLVRIREPEQDARNSPLLRTLPLVVLP